MVVGGLGFFGQRICDSLEAAGLTAVPASRRNGMDLRDRESLLRTVRDVKPAAVICAGGVIASDEAAARPTECFGTNVTGFSNLVESLADRKCHLTLISTAAVYGPSPNALSEESPTEPGSIYGASKLAAEKICDWQAATGRPVCVLRVFNLIGPGQGPRQVPGEFARTAVDAHHHGSRQAIQKVRDPAIRRDFTDVRDAADAVTEIVSRGITGTFNLCSGRTESLAGLARKTSEAVPGNTQLELDSSLNERPADPDVVCGDLSRLREATGWVPQRSLGESVSDLVSELVT